MKAQNLIQNGSFENYTNIDCVYGGFDDYSTIPTTHIVNDWYSFSSPDYYNTICSSAGWFNVPSNIFGYNQTKNGNAYCGIITYLKGGEIKEYIYQHLSSPLTSGKVYCLNFYVAKADRIPCAVANIGAFFSNSLPSMGSTNYLTATPQVINQNGFLTDTTQWVGIQGCFTANGGEQYITIGKFNSTGTDTLNVGTNNAIPNNPDESYYYIDSVTLVEDLSTGINQKDFDHIVVSPNPANDQLHFEFVNEIKDKKIELFDALGNLMLIEYVENKKSSLNLRDLQSGIYYYEISVNGKTIKNDKIIVIK